MEDKKNELDKSRRVGGGTWRNTFPDYTRVHHRATHRYSYTHTQFAQVLFLVLASLQRSDKALEGEDGGKNTEQEGMERIRNDGKLEKRCFRGKRDHKRQLRENNILQVMRHAHTSVHARTTQCSHL